MPKRFSILMTVYDQARELDEHLPRFLNQAYEPGFQVIVVDESSTDDTADVLLRFSHDYPQLYSTFLPRPNRRISRPRMAYTIGVKAARHEWIIIADINRYFMADDMLQAIANTMDDDTQLVLGYTVKQGIRLQTYRQWEDGRLPIRKSERHLASKHPVNVMKYVRGYYDFIIIDKTYAHELLKCFEEPIGGFRLFCLRLSVCWHNLTRRSSTTLLVCE